MMSILTILKFAGAAILALLGGFFGLKISNHKTIKTVEKAEEKVTQAAAKEQAAIKQTQDIAERAQENQQAHEQSIENVEAYADARDKIEGIEEEADEKTADMVSADIADKLKFMRNQTADTD